MESNVLKSLNPNQHGFIKGLGTEPNLLKMQLNIKEIVKEKNKLRGKPSVIFVDFKSAFDKVNWDLLFKKLQLFGI